MISYKKAMEIYEKMKKSSSERREIAGFIYKLIYNNSDYANFAPRIALDFLKQISGELSVARIIDNSLNEINKISQILLRKKNKKKVLMFLKYFYPVILEQVRKKILNHAYIRVEKIGRLGDYTIAIKFYSNPLFKFNKSGLSKLDFKLNRKNKHVLLILPGTSSLNVSTSRYYRYSDITCQVHKKYISKNINALIIFYLVTRGSEYRYFGSYSSSYKVATVFYFLNEHPYIVFSDFKKVDNTEEITNMTPEEFLKKFKPQDKRVRRIICQKLQESDH